MRNYRRSINLNLLDNIHINRKEIVLIWLRGISFAILLISIIIYMFKLIFINISNETFSLKNENIDLPSSDNNEKIYSFNSSFINSDINNDSLFDLDMRYFSKYFYSFNLTLYNNSKKRKNREIEYIYNLYHFNTSGIETPILIDYSSSLPHYPLFAKGNQKCFIRGEIISLLNNNLMNLSCIDISDIYFNDFDFSLRFSLLEKKTKEIKLYIYKEINVKNEMTKKEGIRNIIFYENNNMKKNLRYCSNEFRFFFNFYKNMPDNYVPVFEINWNNKTHIFAWIILN